MKAAASSKSPLEEYRKKRNFASTPEPEEGGEVSLERLLFVVQKHSASRLHYDLRLEWSGVLKSWAVPKGPSLNPLDKRLAVQVEDHPLDYGSFEGAIPRGEYGGGIVLVWDSGWWQPAGNPDAAFQKGHLSFTLHGEKLQGHWSLVRIGGKQKEWLLIKSRDEAATEEKITELRPDSVKTGRSLTEVAQQETDDRQLRERAIKRDEANRKLLLPHLDQAEPEPEPPSVDFMLPTRVGQAPKDRQWLHEIKYDGYRIMARIEAGRVSLSSRRGHDWTGKFPTIVEALRLLPVSSALLDGEIVAQQEDGSISFQALQNALRLRQGNRLLYYVFDLLHINGHNTRQLPLLKRKELLAALFAGAQLDQARIIYGDHAALDGAAVFRQACRMKLEGIVSKKADSRYVSGRSRQWLKVKCAERQEFVVGGYQLLKDSEVDVGSLLLGYYEQQALIYCGRVGTGFDSKERRRLYQHLAGLKRAAAFTDASLSTEARRGAVWVRPEMVVEVEFSEWTGDGRLRHPVYKGQRQDKSAAQVGRERLLQDRQQSEKPAATRQQGGETGMVTRTKPKGVTEVLGVRLTNAERVLYSRQGLTKQDLAEYYASIAELILQDIADRPLVLVRCPEGHEGECFYQKQAGPSVPGIVPRIDVVTSKGLKKYLTARQAADLIGLVQISTLEIHTWGCRADDTEKPDRIIFDLDPDPALAPAITIETALDLRRELADLDLASFVRTTGGKGLHVVVPIARTQPWQQIKDFSRQIAGRLVKREPALRLATMSKARRTGKVFIDHFRNGRGASAIASYSTRARENAPVAVPLDWSELEGLTAFNSYTVQNLAERLGRLPQDPWRDLYRSRQQLTARRLKAAGVKP